MKKLYIIMLIALVLIFLGFMLFLNITFDELSKELDGMVSIINI